jgi:hypothetical protein
VAASVFAGTHPVTGSPRRLTKTVSARNKTAAQDQLEEWKRELAKQWARGTSATVRIALVEWLRYKEACTDSPKTLHEDRRSADNVIGPELSDIPAAGANAAARQKAPRRSGEPFDCVQWLRRHLWLLATSLAAGSGLLHAIQ